MSNIIKSKSSKTNKKVIDEIKPIINEEIMTKKRVIRKKPNINIESKSINKDNKDNKDNKELDKIYKQKEDLDDDNDDNKEEDNIQNESVNNSDNDSESVDSEELDDDNKDEEDDEEKDEEKEEFDEELIDKKIDYLEKEEPEGEDCVYDLEYDEIYDTELDKQSIEVSKEDRITKNIMTSYERVRVLGIRSKQITMGAKVLIKCDDSLSAMEKALKELETGMTPLKIKRSLPNNKFEIWKISELIHK